MKIHLDNIVMCVEMIGSLKMMTELLWILDKQSMDVTEFTNMKRKCRINDDKTAEEKNILHMRHFDTEIQ